MPNNFLDETNQLLSGEFYNADSLESVTEEEVCFLLQNCKLEKKLSVEDFWEAIVVGIALNMSFSKTNKASETEH